MRSSGNSGKPYRAGPAATLGGGASRLASTLYARAVSFAGRGRRIDAQLWLASVVAVVSLLLAVVEIGIHVSHPPPPKRQTMAVVELLQYVLQGSSMVVAGFLVLARRAKAQVLGWMLLVAASVFVMAACLSTWLRFATDITTPVQVAVYAEYALWQVPRVVFVILPLYFPNGRPAGRWTRWLAIGLAVAILAHEALHLLTFRYWHPGGAEMANALYAPRWLGIPWLEVATLVTPPLQAAAWVGVVVATLSPLLRWRRADRTMRRQIAIAVPVFVLLLVGEGLRAIYFWSVWIAASKIAITVLWPAAVGYLIVRDRLYELDRAARRIVAGVVPVVLLAAVYMGAAATMSGVLDDTLPGIGATLAAALAVLAALVGLVLRPVSGWVSARVDQLLYGDRAEPYQVARRLAGRLRDGLGPAQVPVAVCQIVVSALRFPGAALDATSAGRSRRLATVGDVDAAGALAPFDLRYQGQRVGRLLVPPRTGQDGLDELDRAALQPLADLAAPAVSALSLQEELEASRALLISVREDERRRLRRDVHDGLGPSLAAIRLRVDTAMALLPPDSASSSLLADVSVELQEIVGELRRITENLRPPALERLGLGGALADLTARLSSPALPVQLDLPSRLPAVPSAVELAAYRIVAEALANVIRHSAATRATVRLAASDGGITLTVTDDGAGIRPGSAGDGVGLRSMAERARDVGGECEVHSGGTGTAVTARLPTVTAASLV
jgi:two-component system, NarL family, sensor kinase